MVKVHTRTKRKFKLTTSHSHKATFGGKPKPNRPKTFTTEEAAGVYAKDNGITKFELVKVKKNKRFGIRKL